MNIRSVIKKIRIFVTQDIWLIGREEISSRSLFFIRQLRILLLVIKGLFDGNLQVHAAALTYSTVLSIVPLGALIFTFLKSFGLHSDIRDRITSSIPHLFRDVVAAIFNYIETTDVKALGAAGFLILLWMSMSLFKAIGNSFNEIWGIKQSRNFIQRLFIYIAVIVICPFILILAMLLNGVVTGISILLPLAGISTLFILAIQLMVICLVFVMIYKLVPNIYVVWFPSFFSGAIAGILWYLTGWIFISFQIGVSKYNAIYGTFATVPLLLFWLYSSWLIVLLGCKLTFAIQNEQLYTDERQARDASNQVILRLSLSIFYLLALRHTRDEKPIPAEECVHYFNAPARLVQDILYRFERAKIIEAKHTPSEPIGYFPSRPLKEVTPLHIITAIEHYGIDELPFSNNQIMRYVKKIMDLKDQIFSNTELNKPFDRWIELYQKDEERHKSPKFFST